MTASLLRAFLCILILLSFSEGFARMQPQPRDEKHHALNQYVDFTNECIHLLNAARSRLEHFNQEMVEYLVTEDGAPMHFQIDDLVQHYQFSPNLQGACVSLQKAQGPVVNIQHLYESTTYHSQHIPRTTRFGLNSTRNSIMYLMIEFLSLCDTLENYVSNEGYRIEPEMKTAIWVLKRCASLYDDFHELAETLEGQIGEIAAPLPTEIDAMAKITALSKEALVQVRDEQPVELSRTLYRLQNHLSYINVNHDTLRQQLDQLGLGLENARSGYENMQEHARAVMLAAQSYLNHENFDEAYIAYGAGYFYYNHNMLDAYNHHKYGMLAYYNRFLSFADFELVKMVEAPPMFKVVFRPESEIGNMLAEFGNRIRTNTLGTPVIVPVVDTAAFLKKDRTPATSSDEGETNNTIPVAIAPEPKEEDGTGKASDEIVLSHKPITKPEQSGTSNPAESELQVAQVEQMDPKASGELVVLEPEEIEDEPNKTEVQTSTHTDNNKAAPTEKTESQEMAIAETKPSDQEPKENQSVEEGNESKPGPARPTAAPVENPSYVQNPDKGTVLQGAAPNHLIFLVDISSSMGKPEKLPLLQASMTEFIKELRPEDRISLIVYSTQANLILESVSGKETFRIVHEINQLRAGGQSKMQKGLKQAYKLAQKYYVESGNNRIILASDGIVKMNGRSRRMVQRRAWEDITLTTFHLSKGSNPKVMNSLSLLAHLGTGNYYHLTDKNAVEFMIREASAVLDR